MCFFRYLKETFDSCIKKLPKHQIQHTLSRLQKSYNKVLLIKYKLSISISLIVFVLHKLLTKSITLKNPFFCNLIMLPNYSYLKVAYHFVHRCIFKSTKKRKEKNKIYMTSAIRQVCSSQLICLLSKTNQLTPENVKPQIQPINKIKVLLYIKFSPSYYFNVFLCFQILFVYFIQLTCNNIWFQILYMQ